MALVNPLLEDIPRTSDIEFFSSLHGREKRSERGISKRDLKSAVKYGERKKGYPDPATGATRWVYTLGNLVYITDETSTIEITSYCREEQIPLAGLTPGDLLDHARAKDNLKENPRLCTSHTVIVVDHSASMRKPDVLDHENRIKASFGMLALDFVAEQMVSRAACNTDVVSVMLMHDGVDVLFEREPMGRVLYNRFVDIHHKVKPRSHGNYLPSLDQAEKLLQTDSNHPATALCLLFLSDGKPSDNSTGILRCNPQEALVAISTRVRELSANFRQRLSVATLGFASSDQDFSVLQAMAKAACTAGAKGNFYRPELSSVGLGSAIASAVSTLTDTKSHLSSTLMAAPAARSRRALPPIQELPKESADSAHVEGWMVYARGVRRWEYAPESWIDKRDWQQTRLISPAADGIAIRKVPFGEGAERVVYKMQEFDSRRDELVGELLVAKNSKRSSGPDNEASAVTAAESQAQAMRISDAFNAEVQKRLNNISYERNGHVDRRVWGIDFLACSIYRFMDGSVQKFILAEKWLDPRAYTKWNGNNGYVFRGRGQASLPPPSTAAQRVASDAHVDELMNGPPLSVGDDSVAFGEGDDGDFAEGAIDYGTGAEDYMRGDADGSGFGSHKRKRGHQQQVLVDFRPRPTDYLQAFSHFSYAYSERKMLVCDLQGVKSQSSPDNPACAGVFELTDPVVHYQSQAGRKQVYGRTDLGRKGMREFFRTHDCNDVCRLLNLGSRPQEAAPKAAKAAAKAAKAAAKASASRRVGKGKRRKVNLR